MLTPATFTQNVTPSLQRCQKIQQKFNKINGTPGTFGKFYRAKCQEQKLTRYRCEKRINHITNIVNQYLIMHGIVDDNIPLFSISDIHKNRMLSMLCDIIIKYKGNKETQIKIKKGSFKECHVLVRQWWNRQKGYKLGNLLFEPILKLIFEYIALLKSKAINKTEAQKIVIFIDIFQLILNEKLKYNERTMPRPLIPIQIYNKTNKFKKFCQIFLYHFSAKVGNGNGIKWIGFTPYALSETGPNKSQNLSEGYIESLKLLKSKYLLRSMFEDEKNYNTNDMYLWIKSLKYQSLSKQEKLVFVPDKNKRRIGNVQGSMTMNDNDSSMRIARNVYNNYNEGNNELISCLESSGRIEKSSSSSSTLRSFHTDNYHGSKPLIIPESINSRSTDDKTWRELHVSGPRSSQKFNLIHVNRNVNE